jgi:hypothetical protein
MIDDRCGYIGNTDLFNGFYGAASLTFNFFEINSLSND